MAIPVVMTITASRAHAQFVTGGPCGITCTRTTTTAGVSPGVPGSTMTETITVAGQWGLAGFGCIPLPPGCPSGFTQTS
jgi:hypothetical protein